MTADGDDLRSLLLSLHDVGAFILRDTLLKSGLRSPFYVDLRLTVSNPALLRSIGRHLEAAAAQSTSPRALLCGVPYTALPFATAMSIESGVPMVMRRKERKSHGTGKVIEGVFKSGDSCLVVEDLVTSGGSVLETVAALREVGITVTDAVVLLDREQGASANLAAHGITLHSVTNVSNMVSTLREAGRIEVADANKVLTFVSASQVALPAVKPSSANDPELRSYGTRASSARSAVAKRLLQVMTSKQTNLCVAADVTTKEALFMLADAVGPRIAMLKTHADIVTDWDVSTGAELRKLAEQHNFLLFEDRKFADIGNTVLNQVSGGVHRIVDWADIVNAHALPGPGIISGLKAATSKRGLGLVLLAQMSSKGNLTELSGYTEAAGKMAESEPDFVMGFISQGRLNSVKDADSYIYMTPGVKLVAGGDALGQQYNTPEKAIFERGTDVIIVGRGIYQADDPCSEAEKYRVAGWSAYQKRLAQ